MTEAEAKATSEVDAAWEFMDQRFGLSWRAWQAQIQKVVALLTPDPQWIYRVGGQLDTAETLQMAYCIVLMCAHGRIPLWGGWQVEAPLLPVHPPKPAGPG